MNPKTKKFLLLSTSIFAWAIVITVVFISLKSILRYLRYETTNDAQISEYINPVIARVGGYIKTVNYSDYQYVKKGDTLLIIDSNEYRLDAEQVISDIDKHTASHDVLLQQISTLKEEAKEAKQSIQAAEAKVWKQELEYKRYKDLFDKKSATAQKLEETKAHLSIYKSELATTSQHYVVAQGKISELMKQLQVLKAEENKLHELHQRKNIDIGYTVIKAPYDGRLGKRKVEVGQMISPGDPLAYIVNDENPKWVIANFKETQIQHIHLNDTVEVVADAYPDKVYLGKVISFSPATGSSFSLLPPDNSTGNFVKIVQRIPIKIELFMKENQKLDHLISGMNVEVSIQH